MSEEQKAAPAPANTNAEAEKDVQNVLAELNAEGGAPADKPAEKKEDAEEARIIAEAAKLGEKSEKTEEKADSKKPEHESRQDRGRGGRPNWRNNAKFDPTTQKVTDDPVEIRKQVRHPMRRVEFSGLSHASGALRPC